jgi:thioredoxin-related protein
MPYLQYPIRYLEFNDFKINDDSVDIINKEILNSGKKTLIMLQGDFCHWCTKAKPEYQDFGNKYGNDLYVTTIQADGKEEGEQGFSDNNFLNKIAPGFVGFPTYVLYDSKGKYLKTHEGKRTSDALDEFCKSS